MREVNNLTANSSKIIHLLLLIEEIIATAKDLETFRKKAAIWIKENCPVSIRTPIEQNDDYHMGGRNQEYATKDQKLWHKRCYEKGWNAPHWEKKYGGGGLTVKHTSIIADEADIVFL